MNDYVIISDSSKCRQCYSCVRNCPVKAVKIKDGKAEIIQSRCIHCGNCVKHCSRGAKVILDGKETVRRLLKQGQKVIAVLAPSFAASFLPLSVNEVLSKLKKLGFYEVWEAAIGAEYIIDGVSRYTNMKDKKTVLSSACPAFVNLIEKHYPQLINYLIPLCSPMIATGRIIREKYKEQNLNIVFIGPCIAKKAEIKEAQFEGCIDEVLTFEESKKLFAEIDNGISHIGYDENFRYYTSSPKGRGIPLSGGIITNIENEHERNKGLICDGIENCIELVQYINKMQAGFSDFSICDVLMCRGCIDGPCIDNISSLFLKRRTLLDFINLEKNFPQQIDYDANDFSNIDLMRQYNDKSLLLKQPEEEDIKEILASINKLDQEDELNCGACGYNSCREKAAAVYQGIAEVEMCIPYLLAKKNELFIELSQRFKTINELNEELNGIFESSYDGLVVCDTEGNIVKINSAWKKMMALDGEEIPCSVTELEQKGIIYPSATLLTLKEKRRITFIQESRNGRRFIATGNPIVDENGEITGVVTNIRDIEELNRLRYNLINRDVKKTTYNMSGIIANSIEFGEVIELASKAARFHSTVLLLGETGVGKDIIAQYIHHISQVKEGPFIKLNCGAIPENLIESELFGYESGAFTGAKKQGKKGLFELANGGTIFLDEVGDLPLTMQVKLLQVIQDKRIQRIGGSKSIAVDARIVAATNKDLEQMVKDGTFRSDLYYRLNVIPIHIPSLRERKDDIIPLAYHFLEHFNEQYHCSKDFSPEVPPLLLEYLWPGNVRELENIIERVVVTSRQSIITAEDFPSYFFRSKGALKGTIVVNNILQLKDAMDEVERQIITRAYKTYGNTYKIAEVLGINQSTVVRKLKKWGGN